MYNIEESRMYSTYDYIALAGKSNMYIHVGHFHLQFHNCYLHFEYKPLLKQCTILCHLRLWILCKSTILNFWVIAGFWRKLYVPHTTLLHKLENAKCCHKSGTYDYIALTWRHGICTPRFLTTDTAPYCTVTMQKYLCC